MRTTSAAVKLAIFAIVTVLATGLLAVAIGNIRFNDTVSYRAVFSDVTGLLEGDDVRIAGVHVGQVEDIRLVDRDKAEVTFSVLKSRPLAVSTHVAIRYRNLVGQRYVALTEGQGSSQRLEPDGTIPLDQTEPALDLTVLFNGFKPLFQALTPKQVNRLSYEIVRVLQGEGGTINGLLAQTASLTNTLADRDKVIGDVIDNLNEVLATLDKRDEQFSELLVQLQRLVSGLAADRKAIGDSLESINTLTDTTANLLVDARPSLKGDIRDLGRLSANLDENKGMVDDYLQRLPSKLNQINGTAAYGSWFNFYLCSFDAEAKTPLTGSTRTLAAHNDSARCNP